MCWKSPAPSSSSSSSEVNASVYMCVALSFISVTKTCPKPIFIILTLAGKHSIAGEPFLFPFVLFYPPPRCALAFSLSCVNSGPFPQAGSCAALLGCAGSYHCTGRLTSWLIAPKWSEGCRTTFILPCTGELRFLAEQGVTSSPKAL